MSMLTGIVARKKNSLPSAALALAYFVFFLFTLGNIVVGQQPEAGVKLADDWTSKIFKTTTAFNWEPVAAVFLPGVAFFFSPVNVLVALVLSALVFLNITVALFSYDASKVCRARPGFAGMLGFLPSFFAGFSCCVPTFLIAVGTAVPAFTVFFVEVRPFLIPGSILLMLLGLWWSLMRLSMTPGVKQAFRT
jgi:hypothetical protein